MSDKHESSTREIKFRAYITVGADDPRNNTIIDFTIQSLVDPAPPFSIRELLKPWLAAGGQPVQYTGLKDKNGVEIYEGDIVEWWDSYGDPVNLRDKNDFAVRRAVTMDYEAADCDTIIADELRGDAYTDIEVVGNRLENPELLEGK